MIRPIRSPGVLLGMAVGLALGTVVAAVAIWTAPVRGSVRAYTELIAAANQQDVARATALCTERFRARQTFKPAAEGGLVGLPRGIHPNFQAWRQGENVWLCPRNRVGPVYQFVLEGDAWRFDGLVGLLRGRGEFIRLPRDSPRTSPSPFRRGEGGHGHAFPILRLIFSDHPNFGRGLYFFTSRAAPRAREVPQR